ncbi:hypothetical protein BJV78DRAFT_1285190 [Lactifluus subvellereus]|nr:hypothetical protein BJV78DRAFT_1285190 [Lactifluus subvellereus]
MASVEPVVDQVEVLGEVHHTVEEVLPGVNETRRSGRDASGNEELRSADEPPEDEASELSGHVLDERTGSLSESPPQDTPCVFEQPAANVLEPSRSTRRLDSNMPSKSFSSFGKPFRNILPASSKRRQQASSSTLVPSPLSTRSNTPHKSFSFRNIFRNTLPATSGNPGQQQASSATLVSPLPAKWNMPSQLSFRKTVRRMLPTSSRNRQQPSGSLNPVSSEQIGGRGDFAMNAIQTSLAALKDGSALVAKVLYISPVVGLLLQILTMRDEVKQCKVE